MIIAKTAVDAFKEILIRVFGAVISDRGENFLAVIGGCDVISASVVGLTCQVSCGNSHLLKEVEQIWNHSLNELAKEQKTASTCKTEGDKNEV